MKYYSTTRILFVLLFLCAFATSVSAQTKFYVSTHGSDANGGNIKTPFLTIQHAVAIAAKQQGDVEIVLQPGSYAVNRTVEITQGKWSSLIITSSSKETVSISGDITIPARLIQPVKDGQVRKRLQKQVVDSIRVIDFKKQGIKISNLHPVGFGRPSRPAWNELFMDDKALHLSRWPNDSTTLIGKIEVAGNKADKAAGRLPVFHYKESRPKNWNLASDIWVGGYFGKGYADDMIPINKIDTTNCTIQPTMFSIYEFTTGAKFLRWYALNLIEEIDQPGEYAIDYTHKKIYFYPPSKTIGKVRLSMLEQPVMSITDCANVQLKNLRFENSRGMGVYMENTTHVTLDSCTFRNLGSVAVSVGQGAYSKEENLKTHAMESGGEAIAGMIGDLAGRIYADPTFDRHAGKYNGIKNCYIYNVGAGGISLGGGNRKTLSSANNYVENCIIQNYNRIEKSYRPAIWMDGVGCRISKCNISDAPSMAILFHGNNHIIEYSSITNVCTEVDDQGAIYYGRDPSEQGNIIRYNYFKDLSPKHRVTATYHDDGACGSEVYGNIYFRAGSMPALIGGGSDHHYYNNIFIGSPMAIWLDNRLQNWASYFLDSNGVYKSRLKQINYQNEPYKSAYLHLANYLDDNPAFPKRNKIERNLFYNIKNAVDGQTQWGEFWNNWVTNDDPGFVDATDPLKGFKPGAMVFDKITGFKAIPVEKIGCTLPLLHATVNKPKR